MKKVIITGATGQAGSYMIDYLLESTDNLIIAAIRRTSQAILSNIQKHLDNPRLKLVTMDLSDCHSIENLIKEEKPDYFINFGASTFVQDSWGQPSYVMQINAIALIHILEAIRKYAPYCRVYSSGTSERFGDVVYSPQDENHPSRPRSIYGVSKVAAENICKVYRESYGLYVVQGTTFNFESPRRQEYFVTRKITKGAANIFVHNDKTTPPNPIKLGNVYAKRDWSHAYDVVRAIWLMVNQEENNRNFKQLKEYVISSNTVYSVKEFVQKCFDYLNIEGVWVGEGLEEKFILKRETSSLLEKTILVEIDPVFYRPCEVDLLHGDSSLIRKELGWRPIHNIDSLVEDMIRSDIEKAKNL